MNTFIKLENVTHPVDLTDFFKYQVVFAAEATSTTPNMVVIRPLAETHIKDIESAWSYLMRAGLNPTLDIRD